MKSLLLSTTICLSMLASAGLAQGQYSLEQMNDLASQEDSRSGSFLPYPVQGTPGMVRETETGFEVRHERLSFLGFPLVNPVFSISDMGEGKLDITLSSYDLGGDWREDLAEFGSFDTLPAFSGIWNLNDQTYDSYALTGALMADREQRAQIVADLSLTMARGTSGHLTLEVNDLTVVDGGNDALSLEQAQLKFSGENAGGVDPYAITNLLLGALNSEAGPSPASLFGLMAPLTQGILGSDMRADLSLTNLNSLDLPADFALEQFQASLVKSGTDTRGRQTLTLSGTLDQGTLAQDAYNYQTGETERQESEIGAIEFETVLAASDILAAIGGATRLGTLASRMDESTKQQADFSKEVGNFVLALAPRLTSRLNLRNVSSPLPEGAVLATGDSGFELVIDPAQEISLSLQTQDSSLDVPGGWSTTDFDLDAFSSRFAVVLPETFPADLAAAIAGGIEIAADADDLNLSSGLPENLPQKIADLVGQIAPISQIAPQLTAELEGLFFSSTSPYDSTTFAMDQAGYRMGRFMNADGSSQFDYDIEATNLLAFYSEDEGADPITSAQEAAARADAGDRNFRFGLESGSQDFDLNLSPLDSYLESLAGFALQLESVDTEEFSDFRPILEEFALETLDLFNALGLSFAVEGMRIPGNRGRHSWDSTPGFDAQNAALNMSLDRDEGIAYGLIAEGIDFQGDFVEMADVDFDLASLSAQGPAFPDGFGASYVTFYLDTIAAGFATRQADGENVFGPTWGDYARFAGYEYMSRADGALIGLNIEAVPGQLDFTLADLAIAVTGENSSDPIGAQADYRLNWTGLAARAKDKAIEVFLNDLMPQEGALNMDMTLGLQEGGLAMLDQIQMLNLGASIEGIKEQARALSQIAFSATMDEFYARSNSVWLEGTGTFTPDLTVDEDRIERRWASPFDAVVGSPNLSIGLRLTGLEALEQSRQNVLSKGNLSRFPVIQELASSLPELFDILREFGNAQDDGALNYEITVPSWGELQVNARPFPE